ncbi:hypothetical protein Tco_0404771 [Tanacetum coccineum]
MTICLLFSGGCLKNLENDDGKIIEKSFLEIKGKFLENLARDAFSGTNGEDVVEHIEKCSEWPTCSWKEDGHCNEGNFPGQYLIGNQIHYQDYEWYEALVDCELKDEALRNKAELEKSINHEGESSNDVWSNYSPVDEWSDQGEGDNTKPDVNHNPYLDIAQLFNSHTKKERGGDDQEKNENIGEDDDHLVRGDAQLNYECGKCKFIKNPCTKPPECKTEGFEVIKYIFGPTERYVAVKKHGEYEWTTTNENVCHAYQDIFQKMDDEWSVTKPPCWFTTIGERVRRSIPYITLRPNPWFYSSGGMIAIMYVYPVVMGVYMWFVALTGLRLLVKTTNPILLLIRDGSELSILSLQARGVTLEIIIWQSIAFHSSGASGRPEIQGEDFWRVNLEEESAWTNLHFTRGFVEPFVLHFLLFILSVTLPLPITSISSWAGEPPESVVFLTNYSRFTLSKGSTSKRGGSLLIEAEGEPTLKPGDGSRGRKDISSSSLENINLKAIFAKEENESFINNEEVIYQIIRIVNTLSTNKNHRPLLTMLSRRFMANKEDDRIREGSNIERVPTKTMIQRIFMH